MVVKARKGHFQEEGYEARSVIGHFLTKFQAENLLSFLIL
jgi:hypothetical protein